MFGIITSDKEKFLWKESLLSNNSFRGESFENGILSLFPGEDVDTFLFKDDSGSKVLIFEGKLFKGDREINPRQNMQEIAKNIFSLYAKKGPDFIGDLKGEFILGLWDQDLRRFFLARDKLGIRHMHYSLKGDSLIFSSKMNFFHQYGLTEKNVNLDALNLYCSFRFIPSPYTIFKNISKLAAASFIVWENGSVYTKKYWEPVIERSGNKKKFADDIFEIENLIKRSIERRVSGGKAICSYLSGGTDTSTIVGLAKSLNIDNLSVFCAKDEGNRDDSKYAKEVARHFKIRNYQETDITWQDMTRLLPDIVRLLEEPMVDPSSVYLYVINGMAKNYGDIILGGDGGDVLFGPHRFYYLLNLADKLSCFLPQRTFDFIANVSFKPSMKYRFLALRDSRSREVSFLDILSAFPGQDKEKMFTDKVKKGSCDDLDKGLLSTYFDKKIPFIDALIKFDIENILPDMFLLRGNKLARYNFMDYCSPLLDEDLVEYVCKTSESNLFNMLDRKIILKKILGKLNMPSGVVYRKRKPLLAPTGKWLRKGLGKWMKDLLNYKNISAQGFFVPSEVDRLFLSAENDLRAQFQLWSVAFFTLWFEIFIANNTCRESFKTPV